MRLVFSSTETLSPSNQMPQSDTRTWHEVVGQMLEWK